eukprot:TRINITY_DN1543_c0_g3_i1.p1 TRINITY_DN1543_c0_g3~~TRINITY_DN1543_c0_g3_i1.p1  ORF type:complete len:444 (+),score=146.24 TRINITY_DN1543_c0_g3_i1:62-1333(+)
MAEYDLTPSLAPYLDRHLVTVLLNFLEEQKVHPVEQILNAKLALLSQTKMLDLAKTIYCRIHNIDEKEAPASFTDQRPVIVSQLKALEAQCQPLLNVIYNDAQQLRDENNFNLDYLRENFQVTEENVETLYELARFKFDCGGYYDAADYLLCYRLLSKDENRCFMALWGKLAAETLAENYAVALDDFNLLRDAIENRNFPSPVHQLQQRTWLIHWSLFVFFSLEEGRAMILDFLMQEKYLNTIQTSCPHILRYLTAAAFINKNRRRHILNDLLNIIQQESYTYKDPITEFLRCLYVDFDFDAAQEQLRLCSQVVVNDFFLSVIAQEFMESARAFFFETYCRIHRCIDISTLAQRLEMDEESAEKWIANLIRNARLVAKIDSQTNQVIMGNTSPSIYQQVIDKTKTLSTRTQQLIINLEKRKAL